MSAQETMKHITLADAMEMMGKLPTGVRLPGNVIGESVEGGLVVRVEEGVLHVAVYYRVNGKYHCSPMVVIDPETVMDIPGKAEEL